VVLGDVNGDSKINAIDVLLMKKYILKVINDLPSENADGQINSIDFTWLKKYMLKAVEKFPGEASNNL